ncbi:hypothetical protein M8J76_004383 [Diaphorina citri]|nr:hypothetical protein M8J75_008360 [Diaphorina citri]KAI5744686.1 hypothetical protein M8J76_004383 [Diaphorina citri]
MIFTRFGINSTWPAHKNLPIFKKCFFNLLSLKTGCKIISLLWILVFTVFFFFELRTTLTENTDEAFKIRCLFGQTNKDLCPSSVQSDEIFLNGYYNIIVNKSQGFVTNLTKIDDGYYEWNIFCTCFLYTILILFCVILYLGIIYDKTRFILTWLGVTQVFLVLEICLVAFDFGYLIKNDVYLEYLSYLLLVHLGFVCFILYSLLIINSYVVSLVDTQDNVNSMVG